eukprot:Clim_evm25s232 gene=Clim_evmTU25s232
MSKECTVLLIDVGRHMGAPADSSTQPEDPAAESTTTKLDFVKKVALHYLKQKLQAGSKIDEFGLVTFGSRKTNNEVADSLGGYLHINTLHHLGKGTVALARTTDGLDCEDEQADLLEALMVAVRQVRDKKGKWAARRIVCFSDPACPADGQGLFWEVLKKFQSVEGLSLIFVGIPALERFAPEHEGDEPVNAVEMVTCFCENLSDAVTLPYEDMVAALSGVHAKTFRQNTTFRGTLNLGTKLRVPVWTYSKVNERKLDTMSRISTRHEQEQGGVEEHGSTSVTPPPPVEAVRDRQYVVEDDVEVQHTQDDLAKGYKYGTTFVPQSGVDEDNMKLKCAKGLDIVGFLKRNRIPRFHLVGTAVALSAPPGEQEAAVALEALARALEEEECVALARYVARNNSSPSLMMLYPERERDEQHALYMMHLPFADNIRPYTFSSFDRSKQKPNPEQEALMDDIIDVMDLTKNRPEHQFDPLHTFNPLIQYAFQCMHHRVMHPNEPLPDLDSDISRSIEPDKAMFERAGPFLSKMVQTFQVRPRPTKDEEDDAAANGGVNGVAGTARPWYLVDADEDGNSRSVKPRLDATALGLQEGEESNRRTGNADGYALSFAPKVSALDPIRTFHEMIDGSSSSSRASLWQSAKQQMRAIIEKYLDPAEGNFKFKVARDALKALRDAAVTQDDASAYNDLLQTLKKKIGTEVVSELNPGEGTNFWNDYVVKQAQLAPISDAEASTGMTTATASTLGSKTILASDTLPQASTTGADDIEDLLDELE